MKNIPHQLNKDREHFKTPIFSHIEAGMIGVNGKLYINFVLYIETSQFQKLHNEIVFGLSNTPRFDHDFILGEISKHDATGFRRKKFDSPQ